MSADNWMACPRCGKDGEQLIAEARAQYGKLPEEEYMALLSDATERANNLDDTFREDYEFYWRDGNVVASYSCGCNKCGFSHEFRHVSKVSLK